LIVLDAAVTDGMTCQSDESLRGPQLLLAFVSSSSSLSGNFLLNAERRQGFVQKAALPSRNLRGSATMLVGKVNENLITSARFIQ
jgi:hypothetical protein